MADGRPSGVDARIKRRWSFAGSVFDEANWSLIVDGKRTPVESKPLEILRLLLLRAGHVVSKEELLDTIWPDVTVVEASLPTAVRKLRMVLDEPGREGSMIETVSGIGYRFAVPVKVEDCVPDPMHGRAAAMEAGQSPIATLEAISDRRRKRYRTTGFAVLIGLTISVAAIVLSRLAVEPARDGYVALTVSQREQLNALRRLDVAAVERMLAAGWDVDSSYDSDNNGALNLVLGNCEWDPGHDQRKMLLMVRTLIDGGAKIERRNAWGDTPYSIAKTERYCGPDHPVTKMLHRMCNQAVNPLGDRCLADYKRDSSGAVMRQD